jgi:hypothetical protein
MDALGTLERAVSVLGAAEKLSTDGSKSIKLETWSRQDSTLIPYPYWEYNNLGTYKTRKVVFAGNRVSIYFPGSLYAGGETFTGTLAEGVDIEKIQSSNWNLYYVTLSTRCTVPCASGDRDTDIIYKPYKLRYTCGNVNIILTDVAWSDEQEQTRLQQIKQARTDRNYEYDEYQAAEKAHGKQLDEDQFLD